MRMQKGYNVVNHRDIAAWTASWAAKVADPQCAAWFMAPHLRRFLFQERFLKAVRWNQTTAEMCAPKERAVLAAKARAGEKLWAFDSEAVEREVDMGHLADWLAALPEDDPRLVHKVARIGVQEAVRRAEAWSAAIIRTPFEGGFGQIREFLKTGRHSWYDLSDPESLEYESAHMRHCVRRYASRLPAGTRIFSLRDNKGRPHVTVEVLADDTVAQAKGRANRLPAPRYRRAVSDLLNALQAGSVGPDIQWLDLACCPDSGRWGLPRDIGKPAEGLGTPTFVVGDTHAFVCDPDNPDIVLARLVDRGQGQRPRAWISRCVTDWTPKRLAALATAASAAKLEAIDGSETLKKLGLAQRENGRWWSFFSEATPRPSQADADGSRWYLTANGAYLCPVDTYEPAAGFRKSPEGLVSWARLPATAERSREYVALANERSARVVRNLEPFGPREKGRPAIACLDGRWHAFDGAHDFLALSRKLPVTQFEREECADIALSMLPSLASLSPQPNEAARTLAHYLGAWAARTPAISLLLGCDGIADAKRCGRHAEVCERLLRALEWRPAMTASEAEAVVGVTRTFVTKSLEGYGDATEAVRRAGLLDVSMAGWDAIEPAELYRTLEMSLARPGGMPEIPLAATGPVGLRTGGPDSKVLAFAEKTRANALLRQVMGAAAARTAARLGKDVDPAGLTATEAVSWTRCAALSTEPTFAASALRAIVSVASDRADDADWKRAGDRALAALGGRG
jgi:hypothetical protein